MTTLARSLLFQTLSTLPPQQFEQLRFTINPPPGLVPEGVAAQGNRVAAGRMARRAAGWSLCVM